MNANYKVIEVIKWHQRSFDPFLYFFAQSLVLAGFFAAFVFVKAVKWRSTCLRP